MPPWATLRPVMRAFLLALLLALATFGWGCTATPPAGTDDAGVDGGEDPPGEDDGDDDGGEPETDPCDAITCPSGETCVAGVCRSQQCNGQPCRDGEVCVENACIAAACVGVECPAGEACVNGTCFSLGCGDGGTCAQGSVCLEETCTPAACVGVECDAGVSCVAGLCQPPTCGDAGMCPSTQACIDGACVDARCVGLTCPAGQECVAGACVSGCTKTQDKESTCGNAKDDDCDGKADCADDDCANQLCVDDKLPCSRDVCTNGACAHPPIDAGVVCRASVGGCDQAERCTGSSTACPADVFNAACACPENGPISGYGEHDGLRTMAGTNFALRDSNTWTTYAARLDALKLPKVAVSALNLNRDATKMAAKGYPGFLNGFYWESGDLNVTYWIPQGIAAGSSGGKRFIIGSWHYETADGKNASDPAKPADGTDKGVRVTFADVTNPNAVKYRHVLLVEPDGTARGFKPVVNHAGGIAWVGNLLYVADTSRGVRAFDLTRILQVSAADACGSKCGIAGGVACAYGYSYVLPQVGAYFFPTGLSASCRPAFSYVSMDVSTTPPTMLSGEYDNGTTTGIYSRLFRWPTVTGTGRLTTGATGISKPTAAWYQGNRNVQGAMVQGTKFFLNATRYSGMLATGRVGAASRVIRSDNGDWGWMPEGFAMVGNTLWVITEGHANQDRAVYSVDATKVP